MIPKDPVMLMSFLNLKLRDCYDSFEALCEDLDLDPEEIEKILSGAGFSYDREHNCFR